MMISVHKKYIHNLIVVPKTLVIHISETTHPLPLKVRMISPEPNHTWTCLYKMMMHNNSKNYRCKVTKSVSLQFFFFMTSKTESNDSSYLSLVPSPLTLLIFFKHFLHLLSVFSTSHDENIKINTYEWPVQSVWIGTNQLENCFSYYCYDVFFL